MTIKEKKTYFVTGGGTGGHIYPAIAIAQALREDKDTENLFYIGNPNNLEFDIVKKNEFNFLPIKVSGMPRKLSLSLPMWMFRVEKATAKVIYYILKYKPNAIIGTGGYVSAPALFAAKIMNIPYMIHDCDAQPGIVSRVTASSAKAVSVAFEASVKRIKNENIHVNGNPIRTAFRTLTKESARINLNLKNKPTICIMGGSQGAKRINEAAVEIIRTFAEKGVQIIFQTGKKNYDAVRERILQVYPNFEENSGLIVRPYFDDMVTVLKASDIAVSRAGSLSLSEICACSVAPILIPYPHAAADHQRINAKFMVKKGAALYLEDEETTPDTLSEKLFELLKDSKKLKSIQKATEEMAILDSTERIIEQLKSIAK